MNADRAQTIAFLGVAYIVNDTVLMGQFAEQTGLNVADFQLDPSDVGFLSGIIGFLLDDEARVLAFASASDLAPEEPLRAWQLLNGEAEQYRST